MAQETLLFLARVPNGEGRFVGGGGGFPIEGDAHRLLGLEEGE
jgi:hypothetical protein